MKKNKIVIVVLIFIILISLTGCSNSSSSSKRDWEKDAYEQGYYKGANGKWYHK